MKKSILILILLLVSPPVFAQNKPQQNSAQSLASLLTSLKESSAQLRKKNQWMKDQIAATDNGMTDLNIQIKLLDQQISRIHESQKQISAEKGTKNEAALLVQRRIERQNQAIAFLMKNQMAWEDKLKSRERKKKIILRRVSLVQKQIEDLNVQKKEWQEKKIDEGILANQKNAEESVAEESKKVAALEKNTASYRKKQKSPWGKISELQKRNDKLRLQAVELKREQDALVAHDLDKKKEYYNLLREHRKQMIRLNRDIAVKQNRKQDLESILQQVRERLKDKTINFKQTSDDIERANGSLSLLKRENSRLNERVIILQKSLSILEK